MGQGGHDSEEDRLVEDTAWEARLRRVAQLREEGDTAGLLPFLRDADELVRRQAIKGVEETGTTAEGHYILPHLRDRDHEVRMAAIEALGALRYKPAAAELGRVLASDRKELCRIYAAEALGNLGVRGRTTMETLVAAMERDRAPLVRGYAAYSLGQLGLREAMPLLRQRLKRDPSARARARMLAALAMLGDQQAFVGLLRMLRRVRDTILRGAILYMLEDLATPENIPAIRSTLVQIFKRDPSIRVQLIGHDKKLLPEEWQTSEGPEQ